MPRKSGVLRDVDSRMNKVKSQQTNQLKYDRINDSMLYFATL